MSVDGVVFISHEKSDEGIAHEIRNRLEADGFACWMAPDDIRGTTPWPEQIADAIAACDVLLVNEDGRLAAFASVETLVEGETNGVDDIFVIQLEG